MMRHPTRQAINKFNELLGLNEDPYMQDWEIECADPSRVNEFLECYKNHAITDDERFTMMALILGSYEEYHDSPSPKEEYWMRISEILELEFDIHKAHIDYYSCKETEDETEWFPITKLMRRLKNA